ncbi:MAG: hypothetical protein ABIH82_01135 [Candidatus Woesearchaeota archaeon]
MVGVGESVVDKRKSNNDDYKGVITAKKIRTSNITSNQLKDYLQKTPTKLEDTLAIALDNGQLSFHPESEMAQEILRRIKDKHNEKTQVSGQTFVYDPDLALYLADSIEEILSR